MGLHHIRLLFSLKHCRLREKIQIFLILPLSLTPTFSIYNNDMIVLMCNLYYVILCWNSNYGIPSHSNFYHLFQYFDDDLPLSCPVFSDFISYYSSWSSCFSNTVLFDFLKCPIDSWGLCRIHFPWISINFIYFFSSGFWSNVTSVKSVLIMPIPISISLHISLFFSLKNI